jgi:eukaryotic-like serine/threonine-protein kinase
MSREQLVQQLWPDGTFVDFDQSLNKAVNRLREALGDSAEQPRLIETLPRRGYRFIAPVNAPEKIREGLDPDTSQIPWEREHVQGRSVRKRLSLVALIAALAIFFTAIVLFGRKTTRADFGVVHPEGKYSILVADFANTTGESVFDGTLRQGVEAQIEQSPLLGVLSDEQIGRTLQLMGQPPDVRLTPSVVNQICRRQRSSAWIDGSIAKLESQYILGLRAVTCDSNQILAQVQVTANGRKQVLEALGQATTELNSRLGDSLRLVKSFDTPLDQVTTPSIDALQAYTLGRQAMWKRDDAQGIAFFQRAVQLDPNFALAYSALGMSYSNRGQPILAAENSKKAYDLRARVSERERFYIETHYIENTLGDLERARKIYELWELTYPDDVVAKQTWGGSTHG